MTTTDPAPYRTISVEPVTPLIGADVRGVDLSAPIPDEQFAEVRRAFMEHLVLFFRDQKPIAPADQLALGRRFGPLHIHPAAPHLDGHPGLFVIHTHRESKTNNGEAWHSDVSCDTEPPMATMLQLLVLPPCGGDTLFSNQYAAYDDLSPAMKKFVEGLAASHESEHIYRGRYADRGVNDAGRSFPKCEHPIVRTHPETGRRALFVNRIFTRRIVGLEPAESDALLRFLLEHAEKPDYQVRLRWRRNDVALWDNRCTQHMAIWDYWPHERKGHRVTIQGDKPYFIP